MVRQTPGLCLEISLPSALICDATTCLFAAYTAGHLLEWHSASLQGSLPALLQPGGQPRDGFPQAALINLTRVPGESSWFPLLLPTQQCSW